MKNYEQALRALIADLDYDLFKGIERPEDGGPDEFPAMAEKFAEMLGATEVVEVGAHSVRVADIAKMIAEEIEGKTNLLAGGIEWHLDEDYAIEGSEIRLGALVAADAGDLSVELVLNVESVTVR